MASYPFSEIEPKWQRRWLEDKTFRTPDAVDASRPKCYGLDMFPYPSGAGLPIHHRDPFDRPHASQAFDFGARMLSCDAKLDVYGVERIW